MTTYQHPLAYLLAMEGLALLRGWSGQRDETFTRDRLAEVRRLLDDPALTGHPGVHVDRGSAAEGYRQWAPSYDEPNGLFDLDEPFVSEVVDPLPPGAALDAACGTGRLTRLLHRRGHRVVGVDASPEMLQRARSRVPGARFEVGDLTALPLPDASVDLVVCGLALSHLPHLAPAMAELARVLRPSGHLVVTDVHHELVRRGSVVPSRGPGGEPGLVPTYQHTPGDFLRAALPQGLEVRRCEEPGAPGEEVSLSTTGPAPATEGADLGDWEDWPWSLMPLLPAATAAAWDTPSTIHWHLQRAA